MMTLIDLLVDSPLHCTFVEGGSGIMARILGVFGTKICYFIRKNMAENGPLKFHTVL